MKVQNISTNKLLAADCALKQDNVKKTEKAQKSCYAYFDNVLYYKDYSISKKLIPSFKGGNMKNIPSDKQEFSSFISGLNKYSSSEKETILSMLDEIVDLDRWEDIDESLLCEMFYSLSLSTKNFKASDIQKVTDKICELEQEDDYVDINAVMKGIIALCNNLKSDDYRFQRVFIEGYDGFLSCSNEDLVYKLCTLLRDSINGVNEDKFSNLLFIINKNVNADDDRLDQTCKVIDELKNKYGYKNTELLDGLLMYYQEKVPIENIASKLDLRRAVADVYNNLKVNNLPEYVFFEKIFAPTIEELVRRGYSAQEIAAKICLDDFCNKILGIEGIQNADPVILADFIENIPELAKNYDVIKNYTRSSSLFNDILSECNGDLDCIPSNNNYVSDDGYKYSAAEAKSAINELTSLLNNQHIKRNLTVYRGEGIEVLNQLLLNNGEALGDAINSAVKSKDMEKLDAITAEIIGSVIVQPHFMSSAYSKGNAKNFIKHEGGILWQIDVPKGANALYADPFNIEHGLEREILFNRNSVLIITDANFEDGIYTIYADLMPN